MPLSTSRATAPAFGWIINSTWESQTFSTMGGANTLSAQGGNPADNREFTAHIYRSDGVRGHLPALCVRQ